MDKRGKLNQMVVGILLNSSVPYTARELYENAKHEDIRAIRAEGISSFRSFVKVINSFETITVANPGMTGVRKYSISKVLNNKKIQH